MSKKYIVRLESTELHQIEVEAENSDQALEIGLEQIRRCEGEAVPGSFNWGDWADVKEAGEEND